MSRSAGMTKLLVIDTETGGTDPESHSILSLAGVVWADGQLVDELELLIVEQIMCINPHALEINNIDVEEHRHQGIPPNEAVDALNEFIRSNFNDELDLGKKVILAGHNVQFDIGFLKRLFRLAHANFDDLFSYRVLDTASIIRFLNLAGVIHLAGAGSEEAFEYFRIPVPAGQRHTALGDAKATALLLNKLVSVVQTKRTL
jgi:DNA polymerase III subunit epsilon